MPTAIVVGAGAAGAAAAHALLDGGASVVLLEARGRTGGRTHTEVHDNVAWDLGGSWIEGCGEDEHGEMNPMTLLAGAYGVPIATKSDRGGGGVVIGRDRAKLERSGENASRASLSAARRAHRAAMAAVHAAKAALEADASLPDMPVGDVYDEAMAAGKPLTGRAAAWAAHLREYDEGYWGAPFATLSTRHYDLEDGYSGGHAFAYGGYGSVVVRHVAAAVAKGASLTLNAPVMKVAAAAGGAAVTVTLADGREFAADGAVVTAPLGVLKGGGVAFEPPLPAAAAAAVRRLGVGQFNKVVVQFEERFWGEGLGQVQVAGGGDGGGASKYRLWMPLHHDTDGWPLDVDDGPHTLVALLTPEFSARVEGMPDAAVLADALDALKALSPDAPLPAVARFHVTRWGSDPFSRGPFSTLPVGASPGDLGALAEPMCGGAVALAGEHTNPVDYCSVHGAFDSGVRAGRQVLAHMRRGVGGGE